MCGCRLDPLHEGSLAACSTAVGPAHAKALRPKRSKFIRGTSRISPLEDRRHRFGMCWFSSDAM